MNKRRLLTFSIAALFFAVTLLSAPTTRRALASQPQGAAQTEEPPRIALEDFKTMLANHTPVTVIDVRSGISEKIKGAINIPLDQIETRLNEIPPNRPVVTYCS